MLCVHVRCTCVCVYMYVCMGCVYMYRLCVFTGHVYGSCVRVMCMHTGYVCMCVCARMCECLVVKV